MCDGQENRIGGRGCCLDYLFDRFSIFFSIDQFLFKSSFFFLLLFLFFRCKVMLRFDDGFKPESGLFGCQVFFFYNEWKKQRRWWW